MTPALPSGFIWSGTSPSTGRPRTAAEEDGLLRPLAEKIRGWIGEGNRVIFVCGGQECMQRMGHLLARYDLPVRKAAGAFLDGIEAEGAPAGLFLREGRISGGFHLPGMKLVLLSEEEIFGKKVLRRRVRPAREGYFLKSFGELTEGDFVVHTEHGHRPLPGAPEAHRRRDRKRFPADRVSGPGPALSPRGPDRPDPALHRPGRLRPEGGQAGRDLLGDGQGAGEEIGPGDGRGTGLHLCRPGGDGPGGLRRPRPDLRRVLRLLRIRGDAGPGEGDRGDPPRHERRQADGPPDLRRRRVREDRGGDAGLAPGRPRREAGGGPRPHDDPRRAAPPDLFPAAETLSDPRRGPQPLPDEGRAEGDPRRPRAGGRWTS